MGPLDVPGIADQWTRRKKLPYCHWIRCGLENGRRGRPGRAGDDALVMIRVLVVVEAVDGDSDAAPP